MKVKDLIVEGERVSRRCLLLSATTVGEIGGYWGGERSDMPNGVPSGATALRELSHVVTINAALLAPLGVPSKPWPLSLYRAELVSGDVSYRVMQPENVEFHALTCTGEPLYAREERSFPPFEALCLYGSDIVAAWLKKMGLERFEYDAASADRVAREYVGEFVRRSPVHLNNADVVLGGWHQMWQEDAFYFPLEMRLAMLTVRDAEPWIALWLATGLGNWSVREHIA